MRFKHDDSMNWGFWLIERRMRMFGPKKNFNNPENPNNQENHKNTAIKCEKDKTWLSNYRYFGVLNPNIIFTFHKKNNI